MRGGKLKLGTPDVTCDGHVAVQFVYLSPFESRRSIVNRTTYLNMSKDAMK